MSILSKRQKKIQGVLGDHSLSLYLLFLHMIIKLGKRDYRTLVPREFCSIVREMVLERFRTSCQIEEQGFFIGLHHYEVLEIV